jgi:hypothetical protein
VTAEPAPDSQAPGSEFFTAPAQPNQRRYEALRAYFVERIGVAEAGARVGYTRASMASLLRDFRAGKIQMFGPARQTRPEERPGQGPRPGPGGGPAAGGSVGV